MDPVNILIIEDDLLIAEMLKEMLMDLNYSVAGIAKNYSQARNLLIEKPLINLCIVDINLEDEKSGFDIAAELKIQSRPFVFLTSYSDKKTIASAIALGPEAYLIKPFSSTDLYTTIEIIKGKWNNPGNPAKTVLIKDGNQNIKLNTADILWLKTDNIYIEIKTTTKTYLLRNSLDRFLEELNDPVFQRTHRSFAVNINQVNAVTGQHLIIADEKIPLSRKFRDEIHQQFNES